MSHSTGQSMFAADGRQLRLGQLLGQGGEGAVYAIDGEPTVVAKLYTKAPSATQAAKLAAMAKCASPALLSVAAWPTATLHHSKGSSACGLLMPRVSDGKEVHRLYSPAHRKLDFSSADWAFLLRTARNTAAAVNTVHEHGHVIGDVNQGNIMVTAQGVTRFIDCDSFQIHEGQRVYHCEVGVAHFTPPELQGGSFTGVVRTQNHDCFGLAVLCFHLLFVGRHPFAGRFTGRGDMPIERAIKEHRFAFSRDGHSLAMSPPPHALQLFAVSTRIAGLFERAFSPEGTKPKGRPTAIEWVTALDGLESQLTTCASNSAHKYYRDLLSCPWCAIHKQGGPDFFIVFAATARVEADVAVDLSSLWSQFVGLRVPSALVQPPSTSSAAGSTGRPVPADLQALVGRVARAGWAASLLLLACGVLPGPIVLWASLAAVATGAWVQNKLALRKVTTQYRTLLATASERVRYHERLWQDQVKGPWSKLEAGLAQVQRRTQEYEGLRVQHQRELDQMKASAKESQLRAHLQSVFLDRAQIKGIGRGLKATLASYGVETAADITASKLAAIPGFGPGRIKTLGAWRRGAEASFKFDPSRGLGAADRVALANKYGHRFSAIKSEAEAALQELRCLKESSTKNADALRHGHLAKLADHQQARADMATLAPYAQPQAGVATAGALLMAVRVMGTGSTAPAARADVAVPLSVAASRDLTSRPASPSPALPPATRTITPVAASPVPIGPSPLPALLAVPTSPPNSQEGPASPAPGIARGHWSGRYGARHAVLTVTSSTDALATGRLYVDAGGAWAAWDFAATIAPAGKVAGGKHVELRLGNGNQAKGKKSLKLPTRLRGTLATGSSSMTSTDEDNSIRWSFAAPKSTAKKADADDDEE